MLRRCIFSWTVTNRYRPQTKLREGNVSTHDYDSVHGGVSSMQWAGGVHPLARHPPWQTPPLGRQPPGQTPP